MQNDSHPQTKVRYSSQFWLMFVGLVISSTGTTMIWPFLTVYASSKLSMPMAAIMGLMSFNSVAGLVSSILAGSLVDRFGRKGVMTVGLVGAAAVYAGYIFATQYWHFVLLLIFAGFFSPLYRVGTNVTVADVVEAEHRAHAYSITRMGHNIGVALGPILGGFVLAKSYNIGFISASLALLVYGAIVVIFIKETMPTQNARESLREQFLIYKEALKNLRFSWMIVSHTLMEICSTFMWVMLAVHMKNNFAYNEDVYRWLPTTNALMVILLQVVITRFVQRWRDTKVMILGAMFYPISMLIIAFSNHFWGFWLSMVVLTMGELIVSPTASAYVANLAEPEKRGRYLGMFSLTWPLAMAVGPVTGGFLSDKIGITAPWLAAAVVGVLAVLSFWGLDRYSQKKRLQDILSK
ncbi:MAG TPA: MFS transporter [Anaerolineaceae bacterium]|nr:MFS transporter [Anaerolineaceae bacterium]HOH91838.1 MFS transporter [Anaerolineaceae bacterium]HQL92499.1 MFS transporter [Anaerolineaceae bacterium]HQN69111.1 MFS transporter [Anaerolineaceae bacterium]